jgi:hypothetical protein
MFSDGHLARPGHELSEALHKWPLRTLYIELFTTAGGNIIGRIVASGRIKSLDPKMVHLFICEPGRSVHDSPTKTWRPDFGLDLGYCLCDSFAARCIYFGSLAAG